MAAAVDLEDKQSGPGIAVALGSFYKPLIQQQALSVDFKTRKQASCAAPMTALILLALTG